MHGAREGSGIGRDLEGRNEVLSVAHPLGMSAEKEQESILSGFQVAGAVRVSQQSKVVTSWGNMVRCRCLTEQIVIIFQKYGW